MSRLKIETPDQAQLTVERLYKDLERHIIASPPGLCPVDLQLSFLKVCHAQTCGKCVPCRVGLGQLQHLMEDVLDGKADMHTLDLIESTAQNVANSADCFSGRGTVLLGALSTAIRFRPRMLIGASIMLRRQRASHGCSQMRPQAVGNGLSLRMSLTASA